MANTLSGKLDTINDEQILLNMASTRSLYRYVGIIDQVQKVVSTQNMDVTNSAAIEDLLSSMNGKILFTKQDIPSENGVYQLTEGQLNKVTYDHIEEGNLVENLGESNATTSVFYKLGANNSWTAIILSDGTTG